MKTFILILCLCSFNLFAADSIIEKAAKKVGVSTIVLKAICWVESKHDATVINYLDGGPHNSIGLCQVQLPTAKDMGYKGTKEGLLDPYTNAYYAAKYLKYQMTRYGTQDLAILAYNAGSIRLDKKRMPINAQYLFKVREAIEKYLQKAIKNNEL